MKITIEDAKKYVEEMGGNIEEVNDKQGAIEALEAIIHQAKHYVELIRYSD